MEQEQEARAGRKVGMSSPWEVLASPTGAGPAGTALAGSARVLHGQVGMYLLNQLVNRHEKEQEYFRACHQAVCLGKIVRSVYTGEKPGLTLNVSLHRTASPILHF